MKTPYAIGLVVASVLITVAIEETRITSLRSEMMNPELNTALPTRSVAGTSAGITEEATPPLRSKNRPKVKPANPVKPQAGTEDESLAGTARRMWENPAGKSMMNQGVKMAVAMMYEDFINSLDLNKEETDYFKILLGKEMSDQQELGMKMLGATPEEQKSLAEELTKRGEAAKEEIKKFLNSDEDFAKYTDYKNHLPERQQLDGIRSAMSGKGVPLDQETETRLIDTLYQARTHSKSQDLSGAGGMAEMMKGNIVETFEKNWAAQQEILKTETAKFLNEAQMAAFQEHQNQMKEMQLMGLKMAEKMMPGQAPGSPQTKPNQ